MQYLNEIRLVGELLENSVQEKYIGNTFAVVFQLTTDDNQVHNILALDQVARKAGPMLSRNKLYYIVGKLEYVQKQSTCNRCSTNHDNRIARIRISEIVCLGDKSHYSQSFTF